MNIDDQRIYQAILQAVSEGRSCALATVVATRGSTPRKNGAKMLIEPGRGLVGTVGGGCGEAEVIHAAERVLASGAPEMVQVDLTDDPMAWTGSVCGGLLQVFVEPITDLSRGHEES
jgi:xanthine dehydrogenase accessory factor